MNLKDGLFSWVKQMLNGDEKSSSCSTVVIDTVVDALEHAKCKSLCEVS